MVRRKASFLLAGLATLATLASVPAQAGWNSDECVAFAPFQDYCTTGRHVLANPSMWLDILFPPCPVTLEPQAETRCYAGTLRAIADFGEVRLEKRCEVIAFTSGETLVQECTDSGRYVLGATFVHECHSDLVYDEDLREVPPVTTGLGVWGCKFTIQPFF